MDFNYEIIETRTRPGTRVRFLSPLRTHACTCAGAALPSGGACVAHRLARSLALSPRSGLRLGAALGWPLSLAAARRSAAGVCARGACRDGPLPGTDGPAATVFTHVCAPGSLRGEPRLRTCWGMDPEYPYLDSTLLESSLKWYFRSVLQQR